MFFVQSSKKSVKTKHYQGLISGLLCAVLSASVSSDEIDESLIPVNVQVIKRCHSP